MRTYAAALTYFVLTFAAGFALGTIRVLLVVPLVGELIAVLVEVPLMLTIAWLACGWTLQRFQVPATTTDRLVMGSVAFALLMIAEVIVGTMLFGRTLAAQMATFRDVEAQIGLAAQIIYAAFPLISRRIA